MILLFKYWKQNDHFCPTALSPMRFNAKQLPNEVLMQFSSGCGKNCFQLIKLSLKSFPLPKQQFRWNIFGDRILFLLHFCASSVRRWKWNLIIEIIGISPQEKKKKVYEKQEKRRQQFSQTVFIPNPPTRHWKFANFTKFCAAKGGKRKINASAKRSTTSGSAL